MTKCDKKVKKIQKSRIRAYRLSERWALGPNFASLDKDFFIYLLKNDNQPTLALYLKKRNMADFC